MKPVTAGAGAAQLAMPVGRHTPPAPSLRRARCQRGAQRGGRQGRARLRCSGRSHCAQNCCCRPGLSASGQPTRRGTWPGWPLPAGQCPAGHDGQHVLDVLGKGAGLACLGTPMSADEAVEYDCGATARACGWASKQARSAPHLVALLPQPLWRVDELQDFLGAVPHVHACMPAGARAKAQRARMLGAAGQPAELAAPWARLR